MFMRLIQPVIAFLVLVQICCNLNSDLHVPVKKWWLNMGNEKSKDAT